MISIRAALFATLFVCVGGCAGDVANGYVPSKSEPQAHARHRLPVAVPQPTPTFIDFGSAVRDARRIPVQLHALQRTIFWSAASLCVVGLANAGLMLALWSRSRANRSARIASDAGSGDAARVLAPPAALPLARLANDFSVAPNPYGHFITSLELSGKPVAYAAVPRQPGPPAAERPRVESRRCACGEPVAARARARRCERCAKNARPRSKSQSALAS